MVGDGFGGRLWYKPTNYTVGSYSGYSVCPEGETNQLYAWGSNNYGQLGYSISPGSNLPIPVPGMTDLKFYTTGYLMGAIKNDSSGWVWGYSLSVNPMQVISGVKFADASASIVSFIKHDGTVWSVGQNGGMFGDGTFTPFSSVPVQMIGISNAARVACGQFSNYILLEDGTVWRTGETPSGYISLPEKIIGFENIIDIKATTGGMVGLKNNGEVYFFDQTFTGPPEKVNGLEEIVAISGCCDGFKFLAIDQNKNCYSFYNASVMVNAPVETDVIDIMAGETFSYIVKSDLSLWGEGGSVGFDGSIWLNLSNQFREEYTQMDPSQIPGLCTVNGKQAPICNNTLCFPNVFTPNGDGINDKFIFQFEHLKEGKCIILNRWGQVLTEIVLPDNKWDGYYQDKPVKEGVYFYYFEYVDSNGVSGQKNGFFHVK